MHVNSQGALNSWVSSRARQLTKDHQKPWCLFSSRDTHEGTYEHKLSSYLLLVGMPICPSAGNKPQAPSPRQQRLAREPTPSPRLKRLVKLSLNTCLIFLSLVFAPRVSFLSPMPHGLLARRRGPQASRFKELLLLEASHTPRPCGALPLTYRSGGGVALTEGPKT